MTIVVEAGDLARRSPLVRVPFGPGPVPAAVRDTDSGQVLPVQADPLTGEGVFIAVGDLSAGQSRSYQETDEPATAAHPASAVVKLDRVVLQVGGARFADYLVAGGRRPYFWPVVSSTGASVVRGQGSADHPHHTGLAISYGGHSEAGATNIWSDWDEPPYGPGGRMVHRGFRRVTTGAVYGEIVQDLTYLTSDGDAFADEVRTIRWWFSDDDQRFLDFHSEVSRVADHTNGPFLLMARTPEAMDVPETGRVTNSADAATPERVYRVEDRYHAAWTDASGPSGGLPPAAPSGPPEDLPDLRDDAARYRSVGDGPWHGISVLDHPDNDGFPNVVGKYAMVQQITQAHYAPAEAPQGPFSFRTRVLVHAGDADRARLADVAADYARPSAVRRD
ncbi:DUF6807 family protein [Microlunatus sp. Y2014]|uniref:DUF6807 family protein n=1 Tax=Microlunatus sp. Y2014 TaxID=3418488 RepID=UPI003DA74F61